MRVFLDLVHCKRVRKRCRFEKAISGIFSVKRQTRKKSAPLRKEYLYYIMKIRIVKFNFEKIVFS